MSSPVPFRVAIVALCAGAVASSASAQGARILRPSVVSPGARTVRVEPSLAGFRLGEPAAGALARLGRPVKVDTLGSGPDAPLSVADLNSGITLVVSAAEGVGIILVTSRDAGALDSIRVGDPATRVTDRWGPPAAGGETAGLWLAGDYVITVNFNAGGRVMRLGIGFGQ